MKLDRVTPTLTAQEFVNRWRGTTLKERSASQSHFNDLCRVLGWPSPTDVDQAGDWYTFERGVGKTLGSSGWADVWLKGHFGWEYKGPKKNLDEALSQLLNYKSSLEHPPLLVVSDMDVIEVHPQFLNRANKPERFTLDDLLNAERRDRLSEIFSNPDAFKSERTTEEVTRAAATEFAKLAERLRERGADPAGAARLEQGVDEMLNVLLTYLMAPLVLLLQAAGEIPTDLLDLIETLLRLTSLALLVIPVTEVRRMLGGLPAIPLPGGNQISAGRWFSWAVSGAVALFGHSVGWLSPPDFANFQAWYAIEIAILAGVANIIYERFWREQVGQGRAALSHS